MWWCSLPAKSSDQDRIWQTNIWSNKKSCNSRTRQHPLNCKDTSLKLIPPESTRHCQTLEPHNNLILTATSSSKQFVQSCQHSQTIDHGDGGLRTVMHIPTKAAVHYCQSLLSKLSGRKGCFQPCPPLLFSCLPAATPKACCRNNAAPRTRGSPCM